MKLYRVTYELDSEEEILIISDSYPGNKRVVKYINMYKYCGHEMSDEDYKYFVIELGNFKPYTITEIEELEFINIPEKQSQL